MEDIHGGSPSGVNCPPVDGRDLCPELDPGRLVAAAEGVREAEGARFPADDPGRAAAPALFGIEVLRPVGVCFGTRDF